MVSRLALSAVLSVPVSVVGMEAVARTTDSVTGNAMASTTSVSELRWATRLDVSMVLS